MCTGAASLRAASFSLCYSKNRELGSAAAKSCRRSPNSLCLEPKMAHQRKEAPMKLKAMTAAGIVAAVLFGNACATKKYVRNRVNERATPLESRTGELEEASRRKTQDIGRLGKDIENVRQRTDR